MTVKNAAHRDEGEAPLQRTNKHRWIWLALIIALLIFAVAPLSTKHYFTCAICACNRTTVSALQIPISEDQTESDCSRWYRINVEPAHEHLWVRGPYSEMYSVVGLRVGRNQFAGDAEGPVIAFSSYSRLEMYQRCEDPMLARDTFIRLSRWEAHGTPRRDRQRAIERALTSWENANFAGP